MLSIVTFNCQWALQPGFEPYMREILERRRYDFILLQEANDKVVEILRPLYKENKYIRIAVISPKTGEELNTCILYKKEFEFLRSDFVTFTPLVIQQIHETGSVAAVFKTPRALARIIKKKRILIISAHLHGSYRMLGRRKELEQVKDQALHLDPNDECLTLIGGDFNNLIPGEGKMYDKLMKPELTNVTNFNDYTCDTVYLEPVHRNFILARIFFVRGRQYKSKIDHIYMDSGSAKKLRWESKAVDVVASDHRPVELVIKRKSLLRRGE